MPCNHFINFYRVLIDNGNSFCGIRPFFYRVLLVLLSISGFISKKKIDINDSKDLLSVFY